MAKIWKAYVKKHGNIPEDAADLMFFSKKSRTVKTLTLKEAMKVYNQQKNKPVVSKGKKSKKKNDQHTTSQSKTKPKTKSKSKSKSKTKPKSSKKNTKSKKNGNVNGKKSDIKQKKINEKPKSKTKYKNDKSNKKKKSNDKKNKTHKKRGSRLSSTQESKKRNRKKKVEKNKDDNNVKSDNDDNDDDDKMDKQEQQHLNVANEENVNVEDKEIIEDKEKITTNDSDNNNNNEQEEDEKNGISTKKQNMASAFAMFEKSENDTTSSKEKLPETKKVLKKGNRYTNFSKFASGAFSVVYKAKDKNNSNKIVAIKKIHIGGSLVDNKFEPTTKEEGDNEIRILKLVNNHNNTCNLIDTYFDHKLGVNAGYVLCIIMEYMQYTLKDRMEYYANKGEIIPFKLIKLYLFQLCKAVNWIHINNVCHRDIKPENVLIDVKTNRLQLCDFGCSLVMTLNDNDNDNDIDYDYNDYKEDGNETYVMSRFYRAPELIVGNRYYDCKADLWSLGVVFAELFLGTILFMGSSNMDQLREIILKLGWPTENDLKDMNPNINKFDTIDGIYGVDNKCEGESWSMIFCGVFDMEETAINIIEEILVYSPDDRLTALECCTHEYFENLNVKKIKNVPSDLFEWNQQEIKYAKENKEELRYK